MKSLTLKVHGMRCDGCAEKVQKRVAAEHGVTSTRVSLEQARARILYDPQTTDEGRIVGAIEALGYRVAERKTGLKEAS